MKKTIEPFDRTTFVIGAGAHVPYHFPTGRDLVARLKRMHPGFPIKGLNSTDYNEVENLKRILDNTYAKNASRYNLIENKSDSDSGNAHQVYVFKKFCEFIEQFGSSQVPSIDSYLAKYIKEQHYDEVLPIVGKFLISSIIRDYEQQWPISFLEQDWIQLLISEFLATPLTKDNFFADPPNFITFNYDTLFERSILSHLMSYHGHSREEALSLVRKLNITHVYGEIGTLELSDENQVLRHGLQNLKVIGEERSNLDAVKKEITRKLYKTSNLYFLGFGFDEQNMNLLFDQDFENWKDRISNFYSTNIGLSNFRITEIRRRYDLGINFFDGDDVDCLKLISEKAPVFQTRKKHALESQKR